MVNSKLQEFNSQLRDSIYLLQRKEDLLKRVRQNSSTNSSIVSDIERVTPNGVRY